MGQCTLSKFAADTKLGGAADIPAGHAATQRDLNRLEKWANSIFMKCKVLHLGRNNPVHHCVLGTPELESSLAEKDLGDLVDTELNMSQKCALAAKQANGIQYSSRSREVIFSLSSALGRPHLQYWVQFWPPQYKRDMDILKRVQQRPQRR